MNEQHAEAEVDPKRPAFHLSIESEAIANRLRQVAIGETVTYAELSKLIGLNVQVRRGALQTARKILLNEQIVFEAIINVGLKRLNDGECIEVGENRRTRIRRAARHARKILHSIADFAALSTTDKIKHATVGTYLAFVETAGAPRNVKRLELAVSNGEQLPFQRTLEVFRNGDGK